MITEYKPIPQNNSLFFIIQEGEWRSSVDILFEHHFDTSLTNLFLIIKSYLINKDLIVKHVYMVSKNFIEEADIDLRVYHSVKVRRLVRFNFYEFIEWFENCYEENWKYLKEHRYYGFRFVLFDESPALISNKIYPSYPWEKSFNEELLGEIGEFHYISENARLKKKIAQLMEEIEKLKKPNK